MRVLHVLCDLSGGGAERLVLELCRRSASDIQAEVAAVQSGGELAGEFRAAGVPVWCAGRRPGRLGGRALMRLALRARPFDVVHTHLWAGDLWGRAGALLARVPVRVSTEHNIDRDEGRWKHQIKVAMSPLTHRICAVSQATADWCIAQGVSPDRVQVIPNGIELGRFSRPWTGSASGRTLLAVGRLAPQKGFDVLLEAVRDIPGIDLQIAGQGPERAALERSASSQVRLVGSVTDVPERMASADILVIPSRWEGFGLVAAEGMAAGIPVIASAVDGLVEVVGDAGVLVPPEDPMALRRAIQELLASRDRREALSERGRRRAQRFDLSTMINSYEQLYRTLAREHGAR